jgi:hypothetical protein
MICVTCQCRGVEKLWETCGQTVLPPLDWLLRFRNDVISESLS